MANSEIVATRKAFEEFVRNGGTLGRVARNYGRGNYNEGMFRVARLVRQGCYKVKGVPSGLTNGEGLSDGSGRLCDILMELAEKSPDLEIKEIGPPKHRS